MDPSTRCAFCGEPQAPAQLRREFELDFCERCAVGQAESALRARGHSLISREWTTRVRTNNSSHTIHHMSIDARPPEPLEVTVRFTREHALHRLVKLFRHEVEVGDPLFDDFVYVKTRERPQAQALLRSSGVQSTLIDLVGRYDSIDLARGSVQIRHAATEQVLAADAMLAACALLVHIDRIASGSPAHEPQS